jgi:hypothetical protein
MYLFVEIIMEKSQVSTDDMEILPGDRDHYANQLKNLKEIFYNVRTKLHQSYSKNAARYNLRKRDVNI